MGLSTTSRDSVSVESRSKFYPGVMGIEEGVKRYVETQQRRTQKAWTNPWWIGGFLVFVWVFFRWWPAVLMTALVVVSIILELRRRRMESARGTSD
jgi:hypothetical protein